VTVRVPEHVRRLTPYVPGTAIEEVERQLGLRDVVKLASNENPLGPSPRAVEAMRAAAAGAHRYPDGSGGALRRALAARHRVPAGQVVLGNGSTELVEIAAKVFLASGRGAVVGEPSFIMYRIAAEAMAAPLTAVPLRDERHDLEAMAAACRSDTALVYIGNPNNPTGTYVTRSEMEAFFRRVPAHVLTLIDEAYGDYVEAPDYPQGLEFLAAGRQVAVLRTFSKIHGLAGIRIGYAVTTPEVAAALDAVRSPFNTSVLAQAAALAALEDAEHVARCRAENGREVALMSRELDRRGLAFVPTVANFFLVKTRLRGTELYSALLARGVIVRPMEAYGYTHAVRISVGTSAENRRLLEALDRALGGSRVPETASRSSP
jgi:histidinol-phosphate aminotransferase